MVVSQRASLTAPSNDIVLLSYTSALVPHKHTLGEQQIGLTVGQWDIFGSVIVSTEERLTQITV